MGTEEILHVNLTDEQYAAVIDDSRNILCLACAGSGKSRTLAYKIAYLISKGETPESIIAFTFTEKAAESIKRRVAEALHKFGLSENIVGAMFIGTLDAFCQKLLGDINAKYRQFDILDQNRLVLYVMSRFGKLGLKNGQGYFKRIKDFTDAWQTMHNENIALKDIEQYDKELFGRLSCLSESLSADGYMDFSFAIYLAVQELKKINKKEGSYIEKFKYLFVDEYQDINPVQEEFIKTLSGFLDMLFVVGDDDQSIYGWRGANVQNILTFEDRYEGVKVHKLLVNFRSTKAIIETANSFVQKAIPFERLPKEIRYHQNGNIQDLRNLWFQTREDEAKWVARRIKSLIGTTYIEYNSDGTEKNRRGLTYSDFAVLIRGIRSRNGENKDVQFVNAMRELNIPVKTSGEGGIFDRPYAQCILSIMELLRNGTGVNRIDAEKCFNELVLPIFPEADKNKYFKVLQEWYSNIYASATSARRKVYPQNFLHQLADALNLRTLKDETALRDLGLFSNIIKDVEQTYVSIDSEWRYREMLNFLENIAQNYELDSVDYISKIDEALITGSIDLLLKEDEAKNINAAEVIDFKSMEVPDRLEEFDWREMSLQVQLYSRAAKEVIGENAETGYVHTLKNNKRVEVPVDEAAVKNAIGAIEWAVKGILKEDFPMRACLSNCKNCDYRALCRQEREPFKRKELPPLINTPVGEWVIAAFEEKDGEF